MHQTECDKSEEKHCLSICRLSVCLHAAYWLLACMPVLLPPIFPMPVSCLSFRYISSWHLSSSRLCSCRPSFGPAPHPLYTVYTTKCRQKSTKQNAISRKRNTACLYASCLYVCLSPDCLRPACPCSCRLPSWCQKSTTLCKPAKHYQKIIGFKKLRPFSPKEKCIKIFLPLQFPWNSSL
jgi:hypothetical protein